MAARPRIRKRANWPTNMHEPRQGYYVWRDPRDGKTHKIGRVSLAQAIFESHEANAKVAASQPAPRTVAERLDDSHETMADLIKQMPTEGLKKSTLNTRKYQDNVIRNAVGTIKCSALTTKDVAGLLERMKKEGKARMAHAVRSRLAAICRKGCALGWMQSNPVAVTDRVKAPTKRRRLTLDEFNLIYEKAPEVALWLQNAMLLALVSGQDRSTIARWERSFSRAGIASVQRSKTSVRIDIPLDLRMDAIGMTLGDVIARCKSTGVISQYLIHHIKNEGRATRGAYIKLATVSNAFASARELAGIEGDDAPTFHEIRSLAKRLYDTQGGVDTKALLGHMTDEMAEMYANNRGLEPLKVKIR